jgi:hypothetical protein
MERVHRTFKALFVLLILLLVLGTPQAAANSGAPTLNVRAWIDGRSQLILQNNAVYWHHLDYAAPGRHYSSDYQPTYLNGVAWYPRWPDVPDAENRDCDCSSSKYVGVPPLPSSPQTVILNPIQARGQVTIVQQPSQDNRFTLVVEFDDNPQDGPAWYEIDLLYLTKDQCKNQGWQSLVRADGTPFKDQGDCIQYVNTGR